MVLEWHEREHEEDDAIVGNDLGTIAALRDCGLLKFFRIPGMRAQVRLLEYLVHMWDVDQQVFHVGVHTLSLDIEDVYFLTGLSRCGYHASLTGSRGGGLPMSEYCRQYCVPEVERSKGKVAIWGVQDLTLRTILFTIAHMAGSAAPHMALQSYFQYAIECTEPRVFNWSDAVLRSIKRQLTKCRKGDLKQFGYGSLLVSFFLERVPLLRLQVEWGLPAPEDPRMLRWCNLMARHVAGPIIKYNDSFFDWLRPQMLMVDDYAYVGLDFRGDPDLALPEDAQWGDLGKKYTFFHFLNVFVSFIICKCFYVCPRSNYKNSFLMTQTWGLIDLQVPLLFSDEERWLQCHDGMLKIMRQWNKT
jgi:hypothetical protein